MTDRFLVVHQDTETFEGGWSDHPSDPGGKTMYGVTQATYHAWLRKKGQPIKPVRQITKAEAREIYRENYWKPTAVKYNLVPGVDRVTYDAGVNSGIGRGVKWLKASVGSNDHSVTAAKICDKRLAFMMSLRIWKTFGKGWSRRVAFMKAKGVKEALNFMAADPVEKLQPAEVPKKLQDQAVKARENASSAGVKKNTGGGAAAGAGAGAGGVEAVDPSMLDGWLALGLLGLFAVGAIAVIWYSRREAAERETEAQFRAITAVAEQELRGGAG